MALKHTIIPDNWNPLEAVYNSSYNSYDSGPGATLDRSLQLPRRVTNTEGSHQEYYSLYVSSISPRITEVGLKNIFSHFGEPCNVKIMLGKPGTKANFGFVSFSTLREAQVAISELHKKPPCFLNVSFAKSSERGKIIPEKNESLIYSEEYKLPDKSHIDSLPLEPDDLVEENEFEGAIGYDLHYYGGHYCDTYDYEIPSLAKLHWTCNRDGQRVIIGRGGHQKYGFRYSLPDISVDRRWQIETIIKEKVYYNRKKDGIYEYTEEETNETNIGPCNYCSRMTYMVCEQCSATLYCSARCQMRDFPRHRTFCGYGMDLCISTQGEKRSVAVKHETTNSTNSKSHENFKGREKGNISHGKDCDMCSTELVSVHNKLDGTDNRIEEKSLAESSIETEKHVVSGEMKMNMQIHNKSSGTKDDYVSRNGHSGTNDTGHRYNRTDKAFKNQHVNNSREFSSEIPIQVNSRDNENCKNLLQKLKVNIHGPNYSSEAHSQRGCDKNSANFKDFRKSNFQNNMNHAEINDKLSSCQFENPTICMKAESKIEELPPCRQGEPNLVSTQMKLLLPFDVSAEVLISYVVECGEFWVQKQADLLWINNITELLAEEIVNAESLEAPKQKSKCAAKYADDWYRGRVVSTEPLKVQFVDWGNTEEISSIDDVRVLPEKFCEYPPMACKIRLVDGTPDKYLRKKEFETLQVIPLSKACDGALIVRVDKVEEAASESLKKHQMVSDSAHEMQIADEICQTEEPNLSFGTKYTKQDASIEFKKLKKLFPTEDLELNRPIQVEICKIEDQIYWVILQSRKETFSELLYVLQKEAEQSKPLLPSMNDLCLAVHENLWSRGCIQNVEALEVFFFDFGETVECSQDNIKELPEQFHTYPPALVHKLSFVEGTSNEYLKRKEGDCLLIKPILKHDDGSWLVQIEGNTNDIPVEICKMMGHSTNNNILAPSVYTEVVVVEKQSGNENMFYVQLQAMVANLYEMSELLNSSTKVGDYKPDVGTICASLFEEIWCRCCVTSVSHENVTIYYIDYGNTEENVLFERLQPIPEKYAKIPPQAVRVKVVQKDCIENLTLYNKYFIRPISELSDGTPVVHVKKDYIQVEENVNSIAAAYHHEKCPSGERIWLQSIRILPNASVKISYVYDTSTIYVQLTDKNSLDIMEEILQEIGSHCQTAPLMDTRPSIGDLVACKYSKDNNWYRAEILERQEDKYSILFVDYGNKALVTLDNIRRLPDNYKNVPAQCVKIGLADCGATELTPGAQQFLFEFTYQTLTANFKNSDLNSVILRTEGGLIINDKLKEHLMPSWKKALLSNEDPTRNKLFFMEDLEYVTLPQDKVVILKVLLYSPPNILIMCNISTDLHKYVMTTLTDEISDYCNSLSEQTYNPRAHELCCVTVPTACKESIVTSELDEDTAEHGCKKWYRAFCLQSDINSSLVSLVDFGLQLHVPHNCIRCFVPDFTSTPAMACFCIMEGIPKEPSQKLIEKLKIIIQENKVYKVTVSNKQGVNRYSVHVPYIMDVLKTENLL